MTDHHDNISTEPAGPNHLRFRCYSLGRDPDDSTEVVVTLTEALALVRNVLAYVDIETIVRAHIAGNCAVCQNVRTVIVRPRGPESREERVACPSCDYRGVTVPRLRPYGEVRR